MEKYFARFMGRDGRIRRWSVSSDSYTGEPQELTLANDGIMVSEDNSEGGFAPIRSWNGFAYVLDEGNLSELFAIDAHELPMVISVEGGEVEWSGFIGTENRSQPYPGRNEEVEIPLRGKLMTSGGYNMAEVYGMTTLANLLYEALTLSGFNDWDTLIWPDSYSMEDSNAGLSLLAMSVSRTLFFTGAKQKSEVAIGDAEEIPITDTARTILEEVAKLFGYTWYERGGKIVAVSHYCTNYRSISLFDLRTINSLIDFTVISSECISEFAAMTQLETQDQRVSQLQGRHSVSVNLDLQKIDGDLMQFNVEDFAYVNSYKRPLNYSNPKEGYKFLFTQVFECNNFRGLRTYAYYRQSAGTEEDYKEGWYELTDIHSANWYYGDKQGRETKPGCFPARISIADVNPYFDPEYKPGSALNKWLVSSNFTDGFMYNPSYYETGENGFISSQYPIIKLTIKDTGIYSTGAFSLDFKVGAFPVCKSDEASEEPSTPYCRFWVSVRVGEHKYMINQHHTPDGSYSDRGWEITDAEPTKLLIYTIIESENSFPTSMVLKGDRGITRIPNHPMPNIEGMTFPTWDKNGNEVVLSGDIEVTIYADANQWNTGDDKKKKSRLLFISSPKFEFVPQSQYPDGYVPKKDTKERKLHKLTTKGFANGEEAVAIRMGSLSADNSASFSAMMYNGVAMEKVKNLSDGATKAPEEFLLGNLFSYYNRIVERRELVTRQGNQPSAIDTIMMGNALWRQVAISDNYGQGTRTITIEDA